MSKTESIKTLSIRPHPYYIRGQHSKNYIDELTQVLIDAKGEWPFPPVVLQPIPIGDERRIDGAEYWLIDGVHRTGAALGAKRLTIPAEIKSGLSEADAIAMQIQTNNAHGLRLSTSVQTRAIFKLDELGMKGKDIAVKTSLHPSSISRILALKQRPPAPEGSAGTEGTSGAAPAAPAAPKPFNGEAWTKGLIRTLKLWEKNRTKIFKAGFPRDLKEPMDTLAETLLHPETEE